MRWPWDRRRTVQTAAVVTVPAVVATLALVNPGFPLAQVDLNDGAVWLTSTSTLQVGRYNAQVEELNAGLVAASTEFDVLQDAGQVLIVEPGALSVVDPAGVTASAEVTVPAGAQVSMAGGTVAVMDAEGRAWVRTFADLPALQVATDAPDAEVGADGRVVATVTGDALAVAAETGDVTRLTPSTGGATVAEEATGLGGPVDAVTAVGDVPVGLDGGTVRTPGGSADVGMAQPVLQQPGPAAATALVAGSTGLAEIDLSSGAVAAQHEAGGAGTPAAPVRVGSCAHGAWPTVTRNYLVLCDGSEPQILGLDGVTSADRLVFRVNREVVALNETVDGRLWLPLEDTALREPDWTDVVPQDEPEDDAEQSEGDRTTQELVPECSPTSAAPHAVDDAFGVRPGRTTILPVVDNDTSSDCGILVISDVDPLPEDIGTLQPVYGGRALQVVVPADATGSATFSYTVTDGRGASAPSTAEVTLTIRDASLDEPPVQTRTGEVRVEQGATATYPVLSDFVDPDGDPLTLVGATAEQGTARFRQDGTLTYVADGGELGRTVVHVVVSDGTSTTEGTVDVDVRAPGSLDLQLDPVHAVTYVDQDVELDPLAAVRSQGAEPPRLAGVAEVQGTTVTADLDAGTFTFSAPSAGTYYVSFTVTAAPQQAVGVARIDVRERPEQPEPPVAVLDRAWLPQGGQTTVAPLENDTDPAGNVLLLLSVDAPDGLRVAVRQRELVQISAVGVLTEPVTLRYVVSNGTATAVGEIVVSPVPASSTSQPPVVPNAVADVRTGGVVTVPVLEGAYDPDGDELTLVPELAEPLGDGEGLLFVAGDTLRYQAPATPMTVHATFVVRDATGNETAATLTVRVHESDAATKAPPRPRALTARVFAGDTVRIPVPLVGIDPDGDGITLLGVASAGTRGRVTTVGADFLVYEALPGESGTDTFTYAVEDWTGQRAVATVRVGIAERPTDSNRVVARDDAVTIRPGQRVEVRVLDNDTDVAGGSLTLQDDLDVPEGITATVLGSRVVVEGDEPGVLPIGYTAVNERGASNGAVLTVTVDPDAPVLPPVAQDVVVPPVDTVGRTSVDVDVLAVAQNPSGPLSDLAVSVPTSAADVATVGPTGIVTVTLAATAQTIPYLLTNTAADGVRAYAFISVPALGFFPPTARPRAPELRVASGETLRIALDEQVQVAPGRTAQVADGSEVTATRSDGSSLVVDATTVQFTSAPGYAGPASITVPVTDRTGPSDTTARTSVITLPITVYTLDDYPPTFTPSTLEVGPGEAPVTVDLQAFTRGVEGASGADTYTYTISGGSPAGFTATLSGSRLSVSSAVGTPKGTRGTVNLTLGYGRSGSMDVQVDVRTIASNRRLADVPDQVLGDGVQGEARTVDVLNGAYNPFPDQALRIVGATVETPGTGSVSVSGGRVVLLPADDLVGQMVVRVRVRDATDDPSREVSASVTLRVRGVPATPRAPRIGEVRDRTVVLSWDAPDGRGEPIEVYRVTTSPGGRTTSCTSTTCTITELTNDVDYTFTVAAENAVGWSDPSPASAVARPDAVPDTPAAPRWTAFGDGELTAEWDAPNSAGSPVTSYTLMLSPAPPGGQATVTTSATSYRFTGLQNGTAYTVQVRAHNRAPEPSGWSGSSGSDTPAGRPDAPAFPSGAVQSTASQQLQVSWTASASDNGAPLRYVLTIAGGPGADTVSLPATTTTYTVPVPVPNDTTYTFTLRATNKAGDSASVTTTGQAFDVPGAPGTPRVTETSTGTDPGAGWVRVTWDAAPRNGSDITSYEVTSTAGTVEMLRQERTAQISGLGAGQAFTVTIRACNARGCGPTIQAPFENVVRTLPGIPRGLAVVPTSPDATGRPGAAELRWSAPLDQGGSAIVEYQYELARWVLLETLRGTSATAPASVQQAFAGDNGGAATLRVRARNGAGWGSWTEVSVPVTWQDPVEPETGTSG